LNVLHINFVFWDPERKHKELKGLKKRDAKSLQVVFPQCNQQNNILCIPILYKGITWQNEPYL